MEEKYQSPDLHFIGTFALITMNTLPKVLKSKGPKDETEDEFLERDAFRNRCEIFPMTIHHSSKEKFPYDAPMLAKWLLNEINDEEPSNLDVSSMIGTKRSYIDSL